jgi:hypothetical protein
MMNHPYDNNGQPPSSSTTTSSSYAMEPYNNNQNQPDLFINENNHDDTAPGSVVYPNDNDTYDQNMNNYNHNNDNIDNTYDDNNKNNQYDNRYNIDDDQDDNYGDHNNHNNNNDDDHYNNNNNDPYGQPEQPRQTYKGSNNNYDNHNDDEPSESAPYASSLPTPPPERKHKYSTANLKEQGKWKKFCKIFLFFLLMIAIMIGISMLFNHFFFGDTSDNGPQDTALRNENGTFAKDKQEIDSACSTTTLALDEGTLCKEACVPEYFHCCDPFDEFVLYNYTEPKNSTNTTNTTKDDGKLTSDRYNIPEEKNLTFLEGYETDEVCTFDMDVRGCIAYAKCHALAGQTDPAPSNLPELCAMDKIKSDPDACKELCRKLECCYSMESDNCLADKFDLCMDYAPCQNLRALTNSDGVLEIAPRTLDYDCYYQHVSCTKTCEKARCCSEAGDFTCFQYNFLSCITYSPCNNVTQININITQQFNHVPQPSIDLVYACKEHAENKVLEPSDDPTRSCDEICTDAACCWSSNQDDNCFHLDPLGCLAYEAQCQVLQQKSNN